MREENTTLKSPLNQRVRELIKVIDNKGGNFQIITKIPATTLSSIKKDKSEIGKSNLDRIIEAFPSLSLEWLFRGNGNMFFHNKMKEPFAIQFQASKTNTPFYDLPEKIIKSMADMPIKNELQLPFSDINTIAFQYRGDMMLPQYRSGTIFIAEHIDVNSFADAQLHLVITDFISPQVCRMYRTRADTYKLTYNQGQAIEINKDSLRECYVLRGVMDLLT